MYIHALVTIDLERAWAALKCDQLPVGCTYNWVHFGLAHFFCNPLAGSDGSNKSFFKHIFINPVICLECPIKGHTNIADPDQMPCMCVLFA